MGESESLQDSRQPNNHLCVGLLAHVDAGKTTLSEGMLYVSGAIRKMGRVDNRDTILDTDARERTRGITIFSKQARLSCHGIEITLLDTPGHVDFSPEMERTLQAMDYAILLVSGTDGVQGHTRTLWSLLHRYRIPTFLFVNKMDQKRATKEDILAQLKKELDEGCLDFGAQQTGEFYEEAAICEEGALEEFLESGTLQDATLSSLIARRKVFPCYFGSALRLEGIEELLSGICHYAKPMPYPQEFGARAFKVARDAQGNRLTYLKITGGELAVKSTLAGEKVDQIRLYSGEKYEPASQVVAGQVCAVTGLEKSAPGDGYGIEEGRTVPLLEPVLSYQVLSPDGCDAPQLLQKLRLLEEEEPQLHIVWDEELQEIHVQVMGEVQLEILQSLILERYGLDVEFGQGNIRYKETVADTVEGVGHFEPLRHYAEVHLVIEPGEAGSGVQLATSCSEDALSRNWQRLILTHLAEREHPGVLMGAPLTDVKITLAAGKAHLKHTEGGDFRQAAYRAVRQGLKEAECVLLEPYYRFRLEIPADAVGRAMTDIERLYGTMNPPQTDGEDAILTGTAPAATMRDYQKEVYAYTKGRGRLFCEVQGYAPCHNAQEVLEQRAYDSEQDAQNPTGSIFCAHGAGFYVPWDEVKDYMHLESVLDHGKGQEGGPSHGKSQNHDGQGAHAAPTEEEWIGTEEVDQILERASGANRKEKAFARQKPLPPKEYAAPRPKKAEMRERQEEYLLVDGYNIIFAWEDLSELAKVSIDGARGKLMDELCNYQGFRGCHLIVVFDAYRVEGHRTEISDYHNIHVVFTKEAETADQYIEKFAHEHGKKYQVTVATSDGVEQVIIRGQGCRLLSARELAQEIKRAKGEFQEAKMAPTGRAVTPLQGLMPGGGGSS